MPLDTTFAGLSARALGFGSGGAGRIFDNFLRTTVGSLGNAVTGQTWIADNGVMYANGTRAQTSVTANGQQVAIPFKGNATITLADTTNGAGIVFWRTDANNWWAAYHYNYFSGSIYETFLVIIQCVAGHQSFVGDEMVSGPNVSPVVPGSLKVVTSGTSVTATAYSSTTPGVGPLGSPVTASGASATGPGVGILMTGGFGYLTAGDTVGPFTAI